jgi:hypothetical protein
MASGFALAQGEPERGTLGGMLRLGIGVSVGHGAPVMSLGCQQDGENVSVPSRKKQGPLDPQIYEREEFSA